MRKTLSEQLIELYQPVFDMSNLFKEDTNLPRVIWAGVKTGREKHGPRIKVQRTNTNKAIPEDWFSITIEDEPKLVKQSSNELISSKNLKKIIKWIKLNQKTLIKYWNGEISSVGLVKGLVNE